VSSYRSRSRRREPRRDRHDRDDRGRGGRDDRDRGGYGGGRDDRGGGYGGRDSRGGGGGRGRDRGDRADSIPPEDNPRVFLGGITSNENDGDVKEKFREFGRIVDIALKDGYGFIEFESPKDASDAIRELHRRDVFGNGILTV